MLIMLIVMSIILWGLLGKLVYDYVLEKKQKDIQTITEKAQQQANEIIQQARQQAENIIGKAEQQAANIIKTLEEKEKDLLKEEKNLLEKEKELNELVKEEKERLFQIAKLTPEQAKQQVFDEIQQEYESAQLLSHLLFHEAFYC